MYYTNLERGVYQISQNLLKLKQYTNQPTKLNIRLLNQSINQIPQKTNTKKQIKTQKTNTN